MRELLGNSLAGIFSFFLGDLCVDIPTCSRLNSGGCTMLRIDKILLPIDFQDSSKHVVHQGAALQVAEKVGMAPGKHSTRGGGG